MKKQIAHQKKKNVVPSDAYIQHTYSKHVVNDLYNRNRSDELANLTHEQRSYNEMLYLYDTTCVCVAIWNFV